MRDSRAAVRRFLAGHRAAEARQRELLVREGPKPEQAMAECVAALEILQRAGLWPGPRDPVNERDARQVARRWATVKRRYLRATRK